MRLKLLTNHTLILAGSGSGKTVLVRRLVEEAALRGVPSIVIDCAGDLAALGEPWPAPPEAWAPGDEAKAKLLAGQVADATLIADPALSGSDVLLLLGKSFKGIGAKAANDTAAPPAPGTALSPEEACDAAT